MSGFSILRRLNRFLLTWKPIPLCWWFEQRGLPVPKYFIGGASTAPSVTSTSPATSITTTTATASGNITATGGIDPTERGVCYVVGTGTPTLSDTVNSETGTFGTGAFSRNLTGLASGTLYTFRAFATNTKGTGFGANVQFTTEAATVFTGEGVGTLAAITGESTATYTDPVYTGTGVGTLAAITGESTATYTDPVYTGTGAGTLDAVTSAATATFEANELPTVALNVPADLATGVSVTPTFTFTGTDPNTGDTLEYNIQVDTVNTFNSQP